MSSTKDFGITETTLQVPNVFPNPAQDVVFIDQSLSTKIEWKLLNSLGVIVDAGNQAQIDVASLPRGIYLLQLMWDNKQHTHKIIVH